MQKLVSAMVFWMLMSFMAWAETPILSAPEAQQRMQSGDLILLDIRRPSEWAETGVAKGAWPVSMHKDDFGQRLQAILKKHPAENVALICATGGRTNYVTSILSRNGITGVIDLSEGMMGNRRGPGWIKRGLKVVPIDEAQAEYDAALSDP